MDYALVLYFDTATEDYFNDIIKAVAHGGGNTHIIDSMVPPHITIAHFNTDSVSDVIGSLENQGPPFAAGDVIWTSLGSFLPHTLFAAPVLNEYLLGACVNANRLVIPHAQGGLNRYYQPYQWTPHTSLAVRLDDSNINAAFATASRKFSAVSGQCDRLALVEASPYKGIKIWNLTRS